MSHHARKLFAFAILTLGFAVGLQAFLSYRLRRVQTSDLAAFNQAMQGRVNAEIVITGSSRAIRHYDPRVISRLTGLSAFNLGRNASLIDLQLAVLREYLAHNRTPRVLIHNLDIHSFKTTHRGEIFEPGQYVPYLDRSLLYNALQSIDPEVWKWKYIPLYGYAVADTQFTWTMGFPKPFRLPSGEQCFAGYCPIDKHWSDDFAKFKRRHPEGVTIEIDPAAVADLEELIEVSRKAGIQVVLVYSPQYTKMIGLTRNRERIFALFHAIAARHNVPLLDYSYSPISEERNWFFNSQHLNSDGASVFSEDLVRRLVSRGVVPARPRTLAAAPIN